MVVAGISHLLSFLICKMGINLVSVCELGQFQDIPLPQAPLLIEGDQGKVDSIP